MRALQLLAQSSEGEQFRPGSVKWAVAVGDCARACAERQGLEGEVESRFKDDGVKLLGYLVDRLQMVEKSRDVQTVRLVLDPLADYLAALGWLFQLEGEGQGAWDSFLANNFSVKGNQDPGLSQGFLRALYDSAVNAAAPAVLGMAVPSGVLERLAEWAAIEPERIAQEREQRRLRRLIDDLAEPDLAARLQAIEELCRRRSRDGKVIDALGQVLRSEQQDLEVREAAAFALAAQGGESAARALAKMVEATQPAEATAPERAQRRKVMEALGMAAARLPDEAKALRSELMGVLECNLRGNALDVRIEAVLDPAVLNEVTHQVDEYMAQLAAIGSLEGWSEELIARSLQDRIEMLLCQRPTESGGAPGWAEHDALLPLLQGVSRGLQLVASAALPLLGSDPESETRVLMLTLTALQEGEALRIRTEVVTPAVRRLPLPEG